MSTLQVILSCLASLAAGFLVGRRYERRGSPRRSGGKGEKRVSSDRRPVVR